MYLSYSLWNPLDLHSFPTRRSSDLRDEHSTPTLAILSEFDSLPGIGHGCGHNVIAVMGLGAFLALAQLAEEDPSAVPGKVVFLEIGRASCRERVENGEGVGRLR